MKVEIKRIVEVELKYMVVSFEPRYWESAKVNGVEDMDGTLIPFRRNELCEFVIDMETGVIQDWPKGTTAETYYKVCDAGAYYLADEDGFVLLERIDDYVPRKLCTGGWGDYIELEIDQDGKIKNWQPRYWDEKEFEVVSEPYRHPIIYVDNHF